MPRGEQIVAALNCLLARIGSEPIFRSDFRYSLARFGYRGLFGHSNRRPFSLGRAQFTILLFLTRIKLDTFPDKPFSLLDNVKRFSRNRPIYRFGVHFRSVCRPESSFAATAAEAAFGKVWNTARGTLNTDIGLAVAAIPKKAVNINYSDDKRSQENFGF